MHWIVAYFCRRETLSLIICVTKSLLTSRKVLLVRVEKILNENDSKRMPLISAMWNFTSCSNSVREVLNSVENIK